MTGIDHWDVSNVVDFTEAFDGFVGNRNDDTHLIKLSSWNVGKATSMASMFRNTKLDTADISGWDTKSLENINGMFVKHNYDSYTFMNQDISRWSMSNVRSMRHVFSSAQSPTNQPFPDVSAWDVSSVESFEVRCSLSSRVGSTLLRSCSRCARHTNMQKHFESCFQKKTFSRLTIGAVALDRDSLGALQAPLM